MTSLSCEFDLKLKIIFIYPLFKTACPEVEQPHDDLDIRNVGGVFVVLIGGCLVAFIVAWIEFFINVTKIAIEERVCWNYFFSLLCF